MSKSEPIKALCNYWLLALKSPSFESIVKNYFLEISNNLDAQINQGKVDDNFIEEWFKKNNRQALDSEILLSPKSSNFALQSENKTRRIQTKKTILREKTDLSIEINTEEEKENQELLETEISILLVWGFFNQKNPEKSSAVMSIGVLIDLQSGNVCANINLPPRINRKFLNPNQDSNLIIGEFEQSVDFTRTHLVPEGSDIGKWINYSEDFLKATCDIKSLDEIKHSQWESWQFTKRFYYTENISKATEQIGNIYAQICRENGNCSLFKTICLGSPPKPLLEDYPTYEIAHKDELGGHCGHMDSKYPLDATQRMGVVHFLATDIGEVQAINGPPGTGKTSMLKGAIASLFVAPLLDSKIEKPDPPIIIASSATNQAVTNIISSFATFAEESNSPTIASRWITLDTDEGQIVPAKSFGWFLSASSRRDDLDFYRYQHLILNRSGSHSYDKAAQNLEGLNPRDLEAAFFKNFRQALPNQKAGSLREAVKRIRLLVIETRSIQQKVAIQVTKAISKSFLSASLETQLKEDASKFNRDPESVEQVLNELLEGLRNPAFVRKKCAEDANAPELWELFERFCDLTYRVYSFHLTARYWEGRWIVDSSGEVENAQCALSAALRRTCMIAPIIVATAYTLPKLFAVYGNDNQTNYVLGLADVLIIDEAGQVQPEIGTALFSLAKRALVVGDTKQLQPIWSFGILEDNAFLFQAGLDRNSAVLEENGLCISSGSIMKMAQSATSFVEPYTEEPGIMLRRHYRCYSEIIEFCNDLVYGGQLVPFRQRKNDEKLIFILPLLYVTNPYKATKRNGSWCNRDEAKEIAQWLYKNRESIERYYAKEHDLATIVAIVTPYSQQKKILKQELQQLFGEDPGAGDIEIREINATEQNQSSIENESNDRSERTLVDRMTIGTVHALQGAERAIVIFSSVVQRTNGEALFFDQDSSMLNVAISRAKDCFILFGHPDTFFPRNKTVKQSNLPSLRLGRYLRYKGRRLYPRSVVVVESPRKADKLNQILGREFTVYATGGHFQQLEPKGAGIEIEKNFTPSWQIKEKGRSVLLEIQETLADADELILATDDDREGEEISRQVFDWLYQSMPLDSLQVSRVRLRGMSSEAIFQAFCQRSNLSLPLAEAARTRAILDYLIGGLLQEILKEDADIWSGSGRVQAAILGLLAQRKVALEKQREQVNWKVIAKVQVGNEPVSSCFPALLVEFGNQNLRQKLTQENAQYYAQKLQSLKLKVIERPLVTPFTIGYSEPMTTAEIIRRSSDRLNLSPTETMRLLQILYEGSDCQLSSQSQKHNAIEILSTTQTEDETRHNLSSEGHPPITPLDFSLRPELVEQDLPSSQAELYRIIYEGTLASLAEPPALEQIRVRFLAQKTDEVFKLETEAIKIVDPGWLQFDLRKQQNLVPNEEVEKILLRAIETDEPLTIIDTKIEARTQQLQLHTINSLMNVMEKLKIARPSTYGSIFQKLETKGHIVFDQDGFINLTQRGLLTYQAICQLKPIIADPGFTLELESALDAIAEAEESSLAVLRRFWSLIDPQARYSPQKNTTILTIGEQIKAKTSLKHENSQPPVCDHPLHLARKIIQTAIANSQNQLNVTFVEDWKYLPGATKILHLWFLGRLYGINQAPIALLDRLTYDQSFRWFVDFEPNAIVWSVQLYQQAIKRLSDTGMISEIESLIDWSILAQLPNAEIFVGLKQSQLE
jgi:DNA topoisomerase IA